MAVGNQLTKSALDSWMGGFAMSFINDLVTASQIATRVGLLADADLTGLGYAAADITEIRQFAADINALLAIAGGGATQSQLAAPYNAAYDWRATPRRFSGTTA